MLALTATMCSSLLQKTTEPRMFQVWLYTGELIEPTADVLGQSEEELATQKRDVGRLVEGSIKETKNGRISWLDEDLVDLYLLGRRLKLDTIRNVIINELCADHQSLKCTTSVPAVKKAFEKTQHLSQFLIHEADYRLYADDLNIPEDTDEFPREYISGILRRILERQKTSRSEQSAMVLGDDYWERVCRYHVNCVHATAEECAQHWLNMVVQRNCGKNRKQALYTRLSDTGKVIIGPEQIPFMVHISLISSFSDFFRGAFEGRFEEGKTGTVVLEDDSPAEFAMLIHWLYTGNIHLPGKIDYDFLDAIEPRDEASEAEDGYICADPPAPTDLKGRFQDTLVGLYILADKRGVQSLKDDILNQIRDQKDADWPLLVSSVKRISMACDNLPDQDPLRAWLESEASLSWTGPMNLSRSGLRKLPASFLANVMHGILERHEVVYQQHGLERLQTEEDHAEEMQKLRTTYLTDISAVRKQLRTADEKIARIRRTYPDVLRRMAI